MGTSVVLDQYGRSLQERKDLREKLDRLNAIAKTQWDTEEFKRLAAQTITDATYWGFEHENLLGYMTQVQNVAFEDRVVIKEVRGLRAFWLARGGYIEASDLHAETVEMPRDTVGIHTWEFEDKLRTGFAETQATLINLATQRIDAAINSRFFATFQSAIPSSSPYYISGSGLSLTALNTALRQVRDTSLSNEVVIVGRATMTQQIIDQLLGATNGAGFLPETNEQLIQQGVLGVYRGARIITLINWRDDTDTSFFPANELWVIGRDASHAAFFGGPLTQQYVEQGSWYWHWLSRLDFGVLVHRPERARRIVDTSQSA